MSTVAVVGAFGADPLPDDPPPQAARAKDAAIRGAAMSLL
jgi:hypothetical protein